MKMAADVVLSVVETDLRLLAAESKKAEGPMTNLMGMLHHSELPAVKEATERALQKIRGVEHGGLVGVQQAMEILAPFARACETKYAKLACIALSAFQKLLANDAVSIRGRCEIIKALQSAERLSDESVKLRILQASLTIIQSPSFADEQDAVQQLLSVIFRLYVNNKNNFAVHSTAAATIRQAVALIFDHSVMKPRSSAAPTPTIGSPSVTSPLGASISTPLRSGYSAGGAVSLAAAAMAAAADAGTPLGREVVPVLLLEELMGWLGGRDGKELGWVQLQQKGSNKIDRTFLLEMLEAVLLQRAAAIHRLPGLVQCLKTKVAPAVGGLLDSACDRLVDPNDGGDCRLVVRCAAALVRRHHDLAPDRAAAMVVRLAETAGSVGRPGSAHRWQRFMALQALKPLLADPSLLYRLYHLNLPADKAPAAGLAGKGASEPAVVAAAVAGGGGDGSLPAADSATGGTVVPAVVRALHDALRWYVRTTIETPEDDVVAALGNLYLQRAMGARDSVQETEAFGTNLAHGSEVVIAHLALECVLAMVAATEALTDVVVVPAEPGMPSPKLVTRDTPEVRCVAVARLVSVLWRCVLGVCNTLLSRASHDVLVGLLVRGLQGITFSAGALGVMDARDTLLHSLCSHTLLPPGEDDMAVVAAAAAGGGVAAPVLLMAADDRSVGGSSRRLNTSTAAGPGSPPGSGASPSPPPIAPGFLTAILVDRSSSSVRVVLTPRNIAALRSLFNLAHRLADGLGSGGWLYVVDAVNALDRILASPHTTTAAYLAESGSEGDSSAGLQPMNSAVTPINGPGGAASAAAAGGGGTPLPSSAAAAIADGSADDGSTTAQRELRILASAADQLFENTHHMSPEAVVSLLSALSDISHRTLSGLGLLASGAAATGIVSGGSAAAAATLAAAAALAGGGAPAGIAAAAAAAAAGGPVGSLPPGTAPAGSGPVRLCALNRMVDTLLHNLWRVQDLWGIFLAHVLEVLDSNNVHVRAAAVDALDRTITGALNPDLHVPDKFTGPLPCPEDALSPESVAAAARGRTQLPTFPSFAVLPGGTFTPSQPYNIPAGTSPLLGSRRASRDISGGGGGGGGSPLSSSSVMLQPSPGGGGSGGFVRRSSDYTQLQLQPTPVLSPSPASSPFALSVGAAAAAAATTPPVSATAATAVAIRGVQQAAQREDVQHMLLVALDSLYREGGRSPDVRHGLLRIALHVLQHHGDGLTRGWVPMLRLLEAVPRGGQGPGDVRLGFQVVELLATDYLASSLPKEHVAKALDVIAKFAMQDTVLNVSLTAITMLWNVTDHLARSRGTFSRVAAAGAAAHHHHHQHQQQQQQAAAAPTTPPAAGAARPSTVVVTTLAPYSTSGGGASGSSPFSSSLYGGGGGDSSSAPEERQMSPAFAAALSFARGVPSLPAAASPQRSPWPEQQQQQPQQLVVKAPAASATQPGLQPPCGGSYPLHDLDEAESIAMLMIAFRSLKALSVDQRPEARNAAVRTLFLAVGSHGGKFPPATWHELFWSLLFDLLITIHRVSANSSVEEAAAVELGKEKGGRSVVMLVHHSRNSEQKQWDETLVLALAGAAKVLRSYLAVLSRLDVWARAWEELMQVLGDLLGSCRKGVCLASTSLVTTIMQAHGTGPLVTPVMWQQTLVAIDRGVSAMAASNTPAQLQARAELLACISALSAQLVLRSRPTPEPAAEPASSSTTSTTTTTAITTPAQMVVVSEAGPGPDPEQLMLVLRWLDRFARHPVGTDDTSSIHFTTIGPIQKAALAALSALPVAVAAAGVWPAVLSLLCNMLRPFSTLSLRQHAQQVAALQQQRRANPGANSFLFQAETATSSPLPPAASTALDSATSNASAGTGSSREPSAHGGGGGGGFSNSGGSAAASAMLYASCGEVQEARAMSPLWMTRVVELLSTWYRDHVSWQVRVATFPLLVGALSECMACRHLLPRLTSDPVEQQQLDDLWRTAARGLVTVVQTGLPSISICSQGQQHQQQVPHSTWPALARSFQMFFLATNMPPLQQPPAEVQQGLVIALAGAATSASTGPSTPGYFRRMSASAGSGPAPPDGASAQQLSPEQVAADLEITTAVLDCLSETVLMSCQHAPIEMRRALVEVLDAGSASAAAPATAGVGAAAGPGAGAPYDESALPASNRLSHVCLNKLYVLCSRGQERQELDGRDPQLAAKSQLEVAQLALPVFVSRCETILTDYIAAEQCSRTAGTGTVSPSPPVSAATSTADDRDNGGGGAASASLPLALTPLRPPLRPPPAVPSALHDKARHVLELLLQLRVLPVVTDALLPSRPHLRFWVEVSRAVRAQAAMPPPSLAAAAAASSIVPPAAAHAAGSSFGGGSVSGLLLSPPALSRRSSSGFDVLVSPTAGGGGGSMAGDLSFSNGPTGRASGSSFFSRTYSSTGALLSSAMAAAAGNGVTSASVLPSPKRLTATGSGSAGGGSLPPDGRAPPPLMRNVSVNAGAGAALGAVGGVAALSGKQQWVKEQPHLVALYGVLCECIGSSDPTMRAAVQGMLAALGGGMGLCAPP